MINKKSCLKIIIPLIILLFLSSFSYSTSLESINIDAFINDDGSTNVTMYWNYYDNEGTEHFIPMSTNGLEYTNFSVSKNNTEYSYEEYWDIYGSRDDKKDKFGIIDNGNEIELCFGIGEYGDNEYKLNYTVNNMVKNLTDSQILFYKFINDNLSEPPEQMTITLEKSSPFTQEEVLMWGFGFDGEVNLVDGKVVAKSYNPLNSENFATILLRFEPNFFNVHSNNSIDTDFESVKVKAFEGSSYVDYGSVDPYGYEDAYNDDYYSDSYYNPFSFIFPIMVFGFLAILFGSAINSAQSSTNLGISKKDFKGQYHSNIPYDGNLLDIYYIIKRLQLGTYEDYISYFFLKWIADGYLEKVSYETGIFFKKEKDGLKIIKPINSSNKLEVNFFNFLVEAAGSDNMLEENEFNKWMSNNTSRFETFIANLDSDSEEYLLKEGYLIRESKKTLFIKSSVSVLSDKGKVLSEELIKFKNYLYDYSLLNERESYNVHIWDKLMLYAAVFGIAERVQKEFGKLYPNYIKETQFNYSTIYMSNLYSRSIVSSYTTHTSSSSHISSGGFGGGSSIGGGGGSFGGGSGGGTR